MTATLKQATKLLQLAADKKPAEDQLQILMGTGILSDIFDVEDPRVIDRKELQEFLAAQKAKRGKPSQHISVVGSTTLKPMKGNPSLKDLVNAGNYDWKNDWITPDRFPSEVIGTVDKETELVFVKSSRNTTSKEMLAYGAANDLVPASPGDILRLGIQQPELQRQVPYVALHEPVLHPVGRRGVLALWDDDARRYLSLIWFDDDWNSDYVFVFVRKSK